MILSAGFCGRRDATQVECKLLLGGYYSIAASLGYIYALIFLSVMSRKYASQMNVQKGSSDKADKASTGKLSNDSSKTGLQKQEEPEKAPNSSRSIQSQTSFCPEKSEEMLETGGARFVRFELGDEAGIQDDVESQMGQSVTSSKTGSSYTGEQDEGNHYSYSSWDENVNDVDLEEGEPETNDQEEEEQADDEDHQQQDVWSWFVFSIVMRAG